MSFTVASYNVLATAYIKPEWYPLSPRELLDSSRRVPALVEHLAGLGADVLCLQEVEDAVFAAAEAGLAPLGYSGWLAKKGRGRPDGCATFVRGATFEVLRTDRVEFQDGDAGAANSGHVGQILLLKAEGKTLGVANTHLKWDPPALAVEQRFGYRQIGQLLRERERLAPECSGWVICGDLNVTAENALVEKLREAGFGFSHEGIAGAATCNPNRRAKMIDFVFYDRALRAEPLPLAAVEDETALPGDGQPSDHVAVVARLGWRE